MIEEIKNFRINWIDGMKISKEHFIALQNFAQNSNKDIYSALMGVHGYGLLPSQLSELNEYAVNVDAHNSLKISIKKLRAITPNGNRIEITQRTPTVGQDIIAEELTDKKFEEGYILININTEQPVAFGEQNSKEIPPRHPFLTHDYFFTFSNGEQLRKSGLGGNQFPIAKIVAQGSAPIAQTEYIPPSTVLSAHHKLIDFYNEAERFLKTAERNAILIVQKIKTKQSDNPIADAMHIVVDKLYGFLAQQITMVKWEEYQMHPKTVIGIIISFSRLFKNCVDVSTPENKEELFNYFGEWTDLKGGDYENIFINIINLEYDHLDVNQNLEEVMAFINIIDRLFTILTQVDYIGKRRDMGIFVNENVVKNTKTSGGPSFLAE